MFGVFKIITFLECNSNGISVLVIARVIARKTSIVYLKERVKISYWKDICPKFWYHNTCRGKNKGL